MRYLLIICFALITLPVMAVNNMDVSFFFGPSLSQSGNIQDMGDPNFNTAFSYNYYIKESHGIGVSISNEYDFEGTSEQPTIRDGSAHTFELHYAFRYIPKNSRFKFNFQPGFGIQTFYDESQDYYWGYVYYDDISSAWIFNYKLLVDYTLVEWEGDTNFFVGGGLSQVFSFNDEYRGQDISGNRLSFLFQVGVGF